MLKMANGSALWLSQGDLFRGLMPFACSSSSSKDKDPFDVGRCADYLSPLPPFLEPEERGDPEEGENDIFDNEDVFDVPTVPPDPFRKPRKKKTPPKSKKRPRKKPS